MQGGIVREFGMDMYTLLYFKWITSKDLLISTGNYTMLCGRLDGRGVWDGMESGSGWILKQVLCHKASVPHGENQAAFAPMLGV